MMLCRVLRRFDLDLGTPQKNEQFYKSLRELVTILFAVVLGLGLEELDDLDETHRTTDFLFLAIGYFAVVLSWWFYHRATIVGPSEGNTLSYVIDCLLIVNYWFLINRRTNPAHLLVAYTTMFLLYWLWEMVRVCQSFPPPDGDRVKRASAVNFFFFALSFLVTSLCFADLWPFHHSAEMDRRICIISIAFLVVMYRLPIGRIYSKAEDATLKTIGAQEV